MGNTTSSAGSPHASDSFKMGACPVIHDKKESQLSNIPAACPVKSHDTNKPATEGDMKYVSPVQYNVYGEMIDQRNQMPIAANQDPAPGQVISLSTQRINSHIPKGGTTGDTWLYPSPQMFWNALVRKNKAEGASEEYMDTVVAIHNNMNEKTWQQVLAWEDLYAPSARIAGGDPKLLRFTGRPDELSLKAKLLVWLGRDAPFDRHDWVVDRGGKLVRYIIDYYHDEKATKQDKVPSNLSDFSSMRSIIIDVRPALDSPAALLDRMVFMPILRLLGRTTYAPPNMYSFLGIGKFLFSQRTTDSKSLDEMNQKWIDIKTNCTTYKEQLDLCSDSAEGEDCRRARAIALQKCTAQVVCPTFAKDFEDAVSALPQDIAKIENAYSNMSNCLENFTESSRGAR